MLLHAFQMLCPGCVARALPQAQRVAEIFAASPLAVIGTMRAYAMQGTPTTVLFDAEGRRRRQAFGVRDDLPLGAEIGRLLMEIERQAAAVAAQ